MGVVARLSSNNLKYFRERAGLTQWDIAVRLGWPVQPNKTTASPRVQNYEAGRRQPSIEDARRIVQVLKSAGLNVTLDDVFPPTQETILMLG